MQSPKGRPLVTEGVGFLSIGEVLSQIQVEFPELSISKIRFLESKGLIDPERTPSGYRKFYPKDVRRLKRILQIQRETYMPLKMIRDMVQEEELLRSDKGGGNPGATPNLTLVGGHRYLPYDAEDIDEDRHTEEHAVEEPPTVSMQPRLDAEGTEGLQEVVEDSSIQKPRTSEASTATITSPLASPPDSQESIAAVSESPGQLGFAADTRSTNVNGRDVPGEGLFSVEELSRLTGARVSEIAEMESYGLIEFRDYAGEKYYSQIDFEIVQVISTFRKYGVQARHLRMYKTSAEREVGFMEQVIAPLLRQRNPGARKRATEQLSDLKTLGSCLRGYYMEKMLAKYLDL